MRVIHFSVHEFEKLHLQKHAKNLGLESVLCEAQLNIETASKAKGFKAISCFAHDQLDAPVLKQLKDLGVEMVSLRSAGYSHLDVEAAKQLDLCISRVVSYSPESIAEHAVGLLMCLNRKYLKAFARVREFNFTLDGLEGRTLHGKTVGVVGAGFIGTAFIKIMRGFGCRILVVDPQVDPELEAWPDVNYCSLPELLKQSDFISLHCPLTPGTKHLINQESLKLMRTGAILINTGRGGLIQSDDLIQALKERKLGAVGLDVYEYEEGVFFHDLSVEGLQDDKLARLMTFPNVLITSHQAFFTHEALEAIAKISLENIYQYKEGQRESIDFLRF